MIVVAAWLVVPVVLKTFLRASFFEFQAPLTVTASYARDLQEYWSLRLHSNEELIEAVRFPCRRPGEGYAFREFARRHGDFAIVACAAVAGQTGTRLAVGGVADRPTARDLGALEGSALDDALNQIAEGEGQRVIDMIDKLRASCRRVSRTGRPVMSDYFFIAKQLPPLALVLSSQIGCV